MSKIDTPVVKSNTKQFVYVPERDVLDNTFPTIRINHQEFTPGNTYELEEPIATSVNERIRTWQRQALRLLQPHKDVESENIMNRNGSAPGGQYTNNFS